MGKINKNLKSDEIQTGGVHACFIREKPHFLLNKQAEFGFAVGTLRATACPNRASYRASNLIRRQKALSDLFNSNYFCTIKDVFIFRRNGELATGQTNAIWNQTGAKKSIAGGIIAHSVRDMWS